MAPAAVSSQAVADAVRTLAIDRVTAQVVAAMRLEGVSPILLKGPSFAAWLYPGGGRSYLDTDLLVSPACFGRAQAVLVELGFEDYLAGFSVLERATHAATYWQRRPGARQAYFVDLHQSLLSVGVPASEAWALLSADTEELVVAGLAVPTLGPTGRALHVALHAAQHGPGCAQSIEDLRRALAVAGIDQWRSAGVASARLGAEDAFATGLRLLPAGERVAAELGLTERIRPALRLAVTAHARGADSLLGMGAATSLTRRARYAARVLCPSPALMRRGFALARRGRCGLVGAYVARLGAIAWRAGPALADWRRACRP